MIALRETTEGDLGQPRVKADGCGFDGIAVGAGRDAADGVAPVQTKHGRQPAGEGPTLTVGEADRYPTGTGLAGQHRGGATRGREGGCEDVIDGPVR